MRALDPDDNRSPYLQVSDAVRDAITAGEWQPGQRLPARIALTKHFSVSAMTVQNALRVLRDEGVIVSRQGSGVFVHTDAPPRADVHAELVALRQRVERLEAYVHGQPMPLGSWDVTVDDAPRARLFTAVVHREDDYYVAQCQEVDVASQGLDLDAALASLVDAVELHLGETGAPSPATAAPTQGATS